MKIHHYLSFVSISIFGVASLFVLSVQAAETIPATISSNQLCPRGGYICTVEHPPALSGYTFKENLHEGIQGQDVLLLQLFLNKAGVYKGPFLGMFDASTTQAVTKLQTLYNIQPAKGYVGPKTRAFINAVNKFL